MKTLLIVTAILFTPWEDQLRRERPAKHTTHQTRRTANEAKYGVQDNNSDYLRQMRGEDLLRDENGRDGFAQPIMTTQESVKNNQPPMKLSPLFNMNGEIVGKVIETDRAFYFYDAKNKFVSKVHKIQAKNDP